MSADNWDVCPRCELRHRNEALRLRADADAAYGKVSVEEWKLKDGAALEAAVNFKERTFREDYEIGGAQDGSIVVSYNGGCSICGLSLTFSHEVLIEGIEE